MCGTHLFSNKRFRSVKSTENRLEVTLSRAYETCKFGECLGFLLKYRTVLPGTFQRGEKHAYYSTAGGVRLSISLFRPDKKKVSSCPPSDIPSLTRLLIVRMGAVFCLFVPSNNMSSHLLPRIPPTPLDPPSAWSPTCYRDGVVILLLCAARHGEQQPTFKSRCPLTPPSLIRLLWRGMCVVFVVVESCQATR